MKRVHASVLAAIASVLGSCGLLDPRPDPSRYFVLASLEELGGTVEHCPLPENIRVGLGPVRIPEYLLQPELLTRTSATELTRSMTDRWSEPFETMLPRVLADDLSQIFQGRRVELFPWYSTERPDWQIEVEFLRFEPDAQGEVCLIASWQVRELGGAGRTASHQTRIARRGESSQPAGSAATLSAALGELASDLARATCERAAGK